MHLVKAGWELPRIRVGLNYKVYIYHTHLRRAWEIPKLYDNLAALFDCSKLGPALLFPHTPSKRDPQV